MGRTVFPPVPCVPALRARQGSAGLGGAEAGLSPGTFPPVPGRLRRKPCSARRCAAAGPREPPGRAWSECGAWGCGRAGPGAGRGTAGVTRWCRRSERSPSGTGSRSRAAPAPRLLAGRVRPLAPAAPGAPAARGVCDPPRAAGGERGSRRGLRGWAVGNGHSVDTAGGEGRMDGRTDGPSGCDAQLGGWPWPPSPGLPPRVSQPAPCPSPPLAFHAPRAPHFWGWLRDPSLRNAGGAGEQPGRLAGTTPAEQARRAPGLRALPAPRDCPIALAPRPAALACPSTSLAQGRRRRDSPEVRETEARVGWLAACPGPPERLILHWASCSCSSPAVPAPLSSSRLRRRSRGVGGSESWGGGGGLGVLPPPALPCSPLAPPLLFVRR